MNSEEQWFIQELKDRAISDADQIASITTLETLLSLDAVPALVDVLCDSMRSEHVRRSAAMAIRHIGGDASKEVLVRLSASANDALTRELARLAHHSGS